jgi:hypothetical protein
MTPTAAHFNSFADMVAAMKQDPRFTTRRMGPWFDGYEEITR